MLERLLSDFVLERLSPLRAMPARKQVSKKPAGVISKKPAAGSGQYRPVFKTGDIAMKAVFNPGVPFSNGLYAAVVNKNTKGPAVVEFVNQIAVENPEELGGRSKQKFCPQNILLQTHVPRTTFEIAKVSDVESSEMVGGSPGNAVVNSEHLDSPDNNDLDDDFAPHSGTGCK